MVGRQRHMLHVEPLQPHRGQRAALEDEPRDQGRVGPGGHHLGSAGEGRGRRVLVLEAARIGHEARIAASGDKTLPIGAQKRRQLPDEQRRGGGIGIGVAEIAHGPGHGVVIDGHREIGRGHERRAVAQALGGGHVHGDEHLAGTREARGGHEALGPGQKRKIARRLLVAGQHTGDALPHLTQSPGEPQLRAEAVAVGAHVAADHEMVPAAQRICDGSQGRIGLRGHRHGPRTPGPRRWSPPRCAAAGARARRPGRPRWPRPGPPTCPDGNAARAPRATTASWP